MDMEVRGTVDRQGEMFSYMDTESRIWERHPIRAIQRIVDEALVELEPAFGRMYAEVGRGLFRRRICQGRCCCRFCTRCARSG